MAIIVVFIIADIYHDKQRIQRFRGVILTSAIATCLLILPLRWYKLLDTMNLLGRR